MARKTNERRTRRHIWVDDDDWDEITTHFGDTIGTSAAIRNMIKVVLKGIKERANQSGRPVSPAGVSEIVEMARKEQ